MMTAEPDAEPSAATRQRKLPTEPPVPAPDEINRLPPAVISSSVPLQMLLYFNLLYSLFWFPIEIIVYGWRASSVDQISLVFTAIAYAFWFIVEPFRIYVGYTGNLNEKIPQLAAFGLVTMFPQLPLLLYIFIQNLAGSTIVPFHFASELVMILFLIPEVVFCILVLRIMIKSQTFAFFRQWGTSPVEMAEARFFSEANCNH